MAQITVSLEDAPGLRATIRGVLAAAAIGFVAWHSGGAPTDAVCVAAAAGYGHLTAFQPARPTITPRMMVKRTKGRRRG